MKSSEFQYADLNAHRMSLALKESGCVRISLTAQQARLASYLLTQASRLNNRFSLFAGIVAILSFLINIPKSVKVFRSFPKLSEIEAFYLQAKPHAYSSEARGDHVVFIFSR